jgi:deoxycitidine kinase
LAQPIRKIQDPTENTYMYIQHEISHCLGLGYHAAGDFFRFCSCVSELYRFLALPPFQINQQRVNNMSARSAQSVVVASLLVVFGCYALRRLKISRTATQRRRMVTVSVEGNIGAGKSTLLRCLKDDFYVVPEPVALWQDVQVEGTKLDIGQEPEVQGLDCQQGGTNLLQLFYSDPKRWAFLFQVYACYSRMQLCLSELEMEINAMSCKVFERSLPSDKYIFALNCFKTGLMSELEYKVYREIHAGSVDAHPELRPHVYVYLRVTPQTCFRRIQARNRKEEENLTLAYLRQLETRHEEWLGVGSAVSDLEIVTSDDGVPVLVVNWDIDSRSDKARMAQVTEAIRSFCPP